MRPPAGRCLPERWRRHTNITNHQIPMQDLFQRILQDGKLALSLRSLRMSRKSSWCPRGLSQEKMASAGFGEQALRGSLNSLGFSNYDQYLRSSLWQGIRSRVLELNGPLCCLCREEHASEVRQTRYSHDAMSGQTLKMTQALCDGCYQNIEFNHKGKRRSALTGNGKFNDFSEILKNGGTLPWSLASVFADRLCQAIGEVEVCGNR